MKNYQTKKITVKGRVQGVGFRPFVFSIAEKNQIRGTVQNNMDGVKIFAHGEINLLELFIVELSNNSPRLSRIEQIEVEDVVEEVSFTSFTIIESERKGASSLVIPVDAAICEDCLKEMNDEGNFRYKYPFITCTQCGPRYTIIKELPYDREATSMVDFKMCVKCNAEYNDPHNRRHHAEPIACPTCGPTITLASITGEGLCNDATAIKKTIEFLKLGKIVAIKGLGGYHLVCNAVDEQAIQTLRKRKKRPSRPLAVMAKSISAVERIAHINEREKALLFSPEAPIVVVRKKEDTDLAYEVAPGLNSVGIFLPYTPLHQLLFQEDTIDFLIMTSANPSGLPMLYKDEEAFQYLEGIADFILSSNREIEHPIDDSVVQVINDEIQFFRRARGFVPDPIPTKRNVHQIIALGPQQKNTFTIGRYNQIFVGPHIGNMGNIEVTNHYLHELNHLLKWLSIEPTVIAIDMHPAYETSNIAFELPYETIIPVQHHHAHHVACMEDNDLESSCFGLILDGTGYGEDGHIWGFELFYGNASSYIRLGHLCYQPLPGGEKAVMQPWRNAVGMIISSFGSDEGIPLANQIFPNKKSEIDIVAKMIENKINSPLAGTCGRLFDAVSAILGICTESTYDGEAAICLSEVIDENEETQDYYQFELLEQNELIQLSAKKVIKQIIEELLQGIDRKEIVLKFHQTVVEMCVELVLASSKQTPHYEKKIVLTGGSFHNRFLLMKLQNRLKENGFQVFTHKKVPCNDGGISYGQLIVAAKKAMEIERG